MPFLGLQVLAIKEGEERSAPPLGAINMSDHTSSSVERIDPGLENDGNGDASWDSEKTVASGDPEQTAIAQAEQDVPPDGGYGWVCVACAFLINAHTWGVNSVGLCCS